MNNNKDIKKDGVVVVVKTTPQYYTEQPDTRSCYEKISQNKELMDSFSAGVAFFIMVVGLMLMTMFGSNKPPHENLP